MEVCPELNAMARRSYHALVKRLVRTVPQPTTLRSGVPVVLVHLSRAECAAGNAHWQHHLQIVSISLLRWVKYWLKLLTPSP